LHVSDFLADLQRKSLGIFEASYLGAIEIKGWKWILGVSHIESLSVRAGNDIVAGALVSLKLQNFNVSDGI
jgi:hypothetical protein